MLSNYDWGEIALQQDRMEISDLAAIEPDEIRKFGGKAVNLAKLHAIGVHVPNGYAISGIVYSQFFDGILSKKKLLDVLEASEDLEVIFSCASELEQLGYKQDISVHVRKQIASAQDMLERKSRMGAGYAVRSSATIEDGRQFSFAGQAETSLCVTGIENIISSVKKTWLSILAPTAVMYLQSVGIPLSQVQMGVVVQEMVPADVSGVMFTANVTTNDVSQMIIESTWGLGEPLVSGRVKPDSYVLKKNPIRVEREQIGTKEIFCLPRSEDGGVVNHETPDERQSIPSLDDDQIVKIAELGLTIEQEFGCPQDIEWCLKGNDIIIVQTRPITTLGNNS